MKVPDLDIFSDVSKARWIDLAKNQLNGDDPIEALQWFSDSNLPMEAYYDHSDIEKLDEQISFFKKLKPFSWKLYEKVSVSDEKTANKQALEALEGGCDGIIFHIQKDVDFEILLEQILVGVCDISIQGSVNLENIPDNLKGFVLSEKHSTAITCTNQNSITADITNIVKNISNETYILRLASPDFFLEIAAIRALKFLLHNHCTKDLEQIHIHTSVPLHSYKDQQWFLNSTAGLASIIGGTTSINFPTAQGSPRISRNVGNLIREECGITKCEDHCGGSYFTEVLTNKIIEECYRNLKK